MHLIRSMSTDALRGASPLALAFLSRRRRLAPPEVEDFYKGKTVNLLIGYSVGGGYDPYGRLVARHLGKHIPGNPNVHAAEHDRAPAACKAANYLYSVAPKDGIGHRHVLAQPGHRAAARQGRVRQHQVHLARQRHRRGEPVRHPARRAGEDLERTSGHPGHLRRRGRGLRSRYLCAALPQRVRRQDQDRDRLSRHQRNPARDGARRGRRAVRLVLEHAQGPLSALAQGQEGQYPGPGRDQEAAGAGRTCRRRPSSRPGRIRPRS